MAKINQISKWCIFARIAFLVEQLCSNNLRPFLVACYEVRLFWIFCLQFRTFTQTHGHGPQSSNFWTYQKRTFWKCFFENLFYISWYDSSHQKFNRQVQWVQMILIGLNKLSIKTTRAKSWKVFKWKPRRNLRKIDSSWIIQRITIINKFDKNWKIDYKLKRKTSGANSSELFAWKSHSCPWADACRNGTVIWTYLQFTHNPVILHTVVHTVIQWRYTLSNFENLISSFGSSKVLTILET